MAKKRTAILQFIDGFILIAIGEMVLLHIIPHSFETVGVTAIIAAVIGLFLPSSIEKLRGRLAEKAHFITLILGILGIALHSITDGLALSEMFWNQKELNFLSIAVILHRLPVGLTLWWLIKPIYGNRSAIGILVFIAVTTVLGYYLGGQHLAFFESHSIAIIAALMGGSLLHVIFHTTHKEEKSRGWQWPSGLGAILAIIVLYFLNHVVKTVSSHEHLNSSFHLFLNLAKETAPALLLAYIGATLIQSFLPESPIKWMSKGSKFTQALKGMAFGLPLPVCSCGVLPVYKSLVKKGVPVSAGISFFVATPELGLDALLISFPLLGGKLTIIRLICAAFIALFVGWIIAILNKESQSTTQTIEEEKSCCSSQTKEKKSFQWNEVIKNLFEVIDHTGPWILFGIALAAFAEPLLQKYYVANLSPWLEIPLFSLIGIPMYVCASGATPLVAVFIATGVSPGAAIAFLLTGPATNIATFGILKNLYNAKLATLFATLMITTSIILGFIVNYFFLGISTPALKTNQHQHFSTIEMIPLAILTILFIISILKKGPRKWINQILSIEETHNHKHEHGKKNIENKNEKLTKNDPQSSCCSKK